MTYSIENANITFPISSRDKQHAARFAHQQFTPEKQQQVYRNTLAVLTTQHYLEMIGITSDLENSYCWDIITRLSSDIADLYIPEAQGRLECRVVEEGAQTCSVPEETWEDRIGYVFIRLNAEQTEATLLGFVPEVSVERLPLSYLRSLDDLIDRIDEPPPVPPVATAINLRDWLKGIFTEGWQEVEELLVQLRARKLHEWAIRTNARPREMSVEQLIEVIQTSENDQECWLAAEHLWKINPGHPAGGVQRALNLETAFVRQYLALTIAVLPRPEQSVLIRVRVSPTKDNLLPEGLKLIATDTSGNLLHEVQAEKNNKWIQIGLEAVIEEEFYIRVSLDSTSYTEKIKV
jgi:hypothetical protein